jgi:hypothetical protein
LSELSATLHLRMSKARNECFRTSVNLDIVLLWWKLPSMVGCRDTRHYIISTWSIALRPWKVAFTPMVIKANRPRHWKVGVIKARSDHSRLAPPKLLPFKLLLVTTICQSLIGNQFLTSLTISIMDLSIYIETILSIETWSQRTVPYSQKCFS